MHARVSRCCHHSRNAGYREVGHLWCNFMYRPNKTERFPVKVLVQSNYSVYRCSYTRFDLLIDLVKRKGAFETHAQSCQCILCPFIEPLDIIECIYSAYYDQTMIVRIF